MQSHTPCLSWRKSNRRGASMTTPQMKSVFAGTALFAAVLCVAGLPSAAVPPEPLPASEFASLKEAREVQGKLRTVSEKVAPSVVALAYRVKDDTQPEGTGVVIDASGLILTHGHHDMPRGTVLEARFPDGRVVDATVQSVYSGNEQDFSLLKIQQAGRYPVLRCVASSSPSLERGASILDIQ